MTRRALGAPRVLVLTDRVQLPPRRRLVDVVADALEGGADAILLRERDLPACARAELVADVASLCSGAGALLVVAAPAHVGADVAHGLHLRSTDFEPATAAVVGRSCHGVADLVRAADDELDYVTLSPVSASASKPGYGPALGLPGLQSTLLTARRVRRSLPRVLALGGIGPHDAGRWVRAGADGVAVMGAVMRSADPRVTTRAVVDAVTAAAAERAERAERTGRPGHTSGSERTPRGIATRTGERA
jgi:thiamine-phosphate pyrophosphorylase